MPVTADERAEDLRRVAAQQVLDVVVGRTVRPQWSLLVEVCSWSS
ncbi:hypothetical protein ACFWVT_32850 [Streptomyces cyaneofuscatus]